MLLGLSRSALLAWAMRQSRMKPAEIIRRMDISLDRFKEIEREYLRKSGCYSWRSSSWIIERSMKDLGYSCLEDLLAEAKSYLSTDGEPESFKVEGSIFRGVLTDREMAVWTLKKAGRKKRETAGIFSVTPERIRQIESKAIRKMKKWLQNGGTESDAIASSLPSWGCSSFDELLKKSREFVDPPPSGPEIPWLETVEGQKWAAQQKAETKRIQDEISKKLQAAIDSGRPQDIEYRRLCEEESMPPIPSILNTDGSALNYQRPSG
jgi:hypothetical protein